MHFYLGRFRDSGAIILTIFTLSGIISLSFPGLGNRSEGSLCSHEVRLRLHLFGRG